MQIHKNRVSASVAVLTVVAVALVGCAGAAQPPGHSETPVPPGENYAITVPVSEEQFMKELLGQQGFTDLEGIREEYARAVEIWPFALPDGYRFPAESLTNGPEEGDNVMWERGNGVARAYILWRQATAKAALAAHERGNDQDANAHLAALVDAQESEIARSFIEDPDNSYVNIIVLPALERGDYSYLKEYHSL